MVASVVDSAKYLGDAFATGCKFTIDVSSLDIQGNDLLLFFCNGEVVASSASYPTGWAQENFYSGSGFYRNFRVVFSKTADGTESSLVFTINGDVQKSGDGYFLVIRGGIPTVKSASYSSKSYGSPTNSSNVSAVENDLAIAFFGAMAGSTLSGSLGIWDAMLQENLSGYADQIIYYRTVPTGETSSGTASVTWSTSDANNNCHASTVVVEDVPLVSQSAEGTIGSSGELSTQFIPAPQFVGSVESSLDDVPYTAIAELLSGLDPETNYQVRVKAVDSDGLESDFTDYIQFTTGRVLSQGLFSNLDFAGNSNFKLLRALEGDISISAPPLSIEQRMTRGILGLSGSLVTSHFIAQYMGQVESALGAVPWTAIAEYLTELPGGNYQVRVKAVDSNGLESDFTDFLVFATNIPPLVPTNLAGSRVATGYLFQSNVDDPDGDPVKVRYQVWEVE